MEKNITLRPSDLGMGARYAAPSRRHTPTLLPWLRTAEDGAKKAAAYPVEWLRQYYSGVLHKEISTRRTLRLVHAQLAFAMAVFPTYDSLLVHVAAALWLVWAAARCRS